MDYVWIVDCLGGERGKNGSDGKLVVSYRFVFSISVVAEHYFFGEHETIT